MAAEITGLTRDEVMGQNLVNVYMAEELRASVKEYKRDLVLRIRDLIPCICEGCARHIRNTIAL